MKKKRVLIISYYWPPSGGVGVNRCLKFAKYLPDFDWEPVVYAPSNASYPYTDETNFKHIPEEITILKQPIKEPFELFKKLSGRKKNDSANPVYVRDRKRSVIDEFAIWVRGNFFIPDARALWIKPSVRYLKKYLTEHPVDAILTDGPPHTNTVIGCKLSQATGIPWLADFQDPWTQVDYYSMLKIGKRADKKHHALEQECFQTAKKITIASPTWAKDIVSIGADNVDPIFWGYDDDDFPEITPPDDKTFSIVHAGQLGYDRRPDGFLSMLGELKKENPEFGKLLRLKFVGTVDYVIEETIKENGLSENYFAPGNISRPQAIDLTLKAQLLLLPLNIAENAKGRIPGKLFENLRASKPILVLGPTNSDVSKIVTDANAGITCAYDDVKTQKAFILDRFEKFKQGKNHIDLGNIKAYSVKNQVKRLSGFLNKISV
ncbi:MAG: glycosyl transferase family 1 [Bacteroidota bacterium]|nr:glycosyl transferase family 1 [Bacteroidota bacterium]